MTASWLHKFNLIVILIKQLPISKTISIIKLPRLIISCLKRSREKQEETTSSSKLWETKSVTYIVPVISITLRWTLFRKFRLQARSWCIRLWEVGLKSTMCPNQRGDHCKLKKDLELNWILQLRNILSRWTRSKRREQNLQRKLDWLIWCPISNRMEWIRTGWPVHHLQIHLCNRIHNLEELRANHQPIECRECK